MNGKTKPAPNSTRIKRFFETGLKINQLRILVALEQLGQVQKVADALHVTQPAISKQLRELESDSGIRLFNRTGNRIEFTPVGARLARRAGEILQQLTNVEVEIAALAQGLSGALSIGTVTTAAQILVPQAILRFLQLAPKARIKLVEGPADELFSLLEAGKLDIVVARIPDNEGPRPGVSTVLLNDPLVICCGVKHPLASNRDLDWPDLAKAGWITPAMSSPAYKALATLLDEKKLSLHMAVESISLTANVAMLGASELICLLPLSFAKRLAQEHRIAILPVPTDRLLATVSAHWRSDGSNPLTAIMANCLDEVGKAL